jgi:hypothetical protein
MSMDYPLYEELRRRKHPAAKWWMIGDKLYYLGLLPAAMSVATAPVLALDRLLGGQYWRLLWPLLVIFPFAVAVFFIGSLLKGYVHRVAEREGIKW